MTRFTLRVAGITAMTVAVLLAGQGMAQAGDSGAAAGPGRRIVMQDGAGTVSVPLATGDSKARWTAKYGATGDGGVSTMGAGYYVSQGYANGPIGSQSFKAYGNANWSNGCGFWECTGSWTNNYAKIQWLGSTPWNANVINASMKWWIGGVNVSPSLPPGVGFSKDGSSITWQPGAVNDTWQVELNYQAAVNIHAQYINTLYFKAQGDVLLGSNWYHVEGNVAAASAS